MHDRTPAGPDDSASKVARAIRLDLFIAIFAVLISCLAAGASWWQGHILQDQLGAQVWPYVSVSIGTDGSSVKISISNDGLGPAVLRSVSATVDGVPKANFIDIMHAVLGPKIVARVPHGEKINLYLSGERPGSVMRPGDQTVAFELKSKRYALALLRAFPRMTFRTCYCAIIPGKCWLSNSAASTDPQPVQTCYEDPKDLLHAPTIDELLNPNF
jgi:hypothetical protein